MDSFWNVDLLKDWLSIEVINNIIVPVAPTSDNEHEHAWGLDVGMQSTLLLLLKINCVSSTCWVTTTKSVAVGNSREGATFLFG